MSKILVLYDNWMRDDAQEMWKTAFAETEISDDHEIVYKENISGSFKWSTETVDNVREANGNPSYIKENIVGCDVVVSGYAPITSEVMAESCSLKIVGISRGGPVNVDHQAATERGIYVLKSVGRNAESVADQTMGLIISESRFISRLNHEVKTGKYFEKLKQGGRSGYLGSFNWTELKGKTLGLIGYGQVGKRVAKRAQAFGMEVIVFDPYIDSNTIAKDKCSGVDMDYLLGHSDFVSVHAKHTPETHHMINEETLAKMKKTVVLINTSRGGLIDENALFAALKDGVIASAALDVFEDDPVKQDNPLIQLDNVTVTPHSAGRSPETEMRGYRQIAKQVVAYLNGEGINPLHVSNKEIL